MRRFSIFMAACVVVLTGMADATDKRCTNLPPGLNHLKRGVDITTLDLMPQNAGANSGLRLPLFDFTCKLEHVWTNPYDGVEYDQPDQVVDLVSIPAGGVVNGDVSIMKTPSDIRKSMSLSVGGNLVNGMFSASDSYNKMKRTIMNTTSYIEQVTAFHTAFRADMAPYWVIQLNSYAKTFIERRLPLTFVAGQNQYLEFIRQFGTHYFGFGKYGGLMLYRMTTDRETFIKLGDRKVKAAAKGSFLNFLKANAVYSGAFHGVPTKFSSNTTVTRRYFGGSTTRDDYKAWYANVQNHPWLFGGRLEPITKIITDVRKRAAMAKAVQIYMTKAYLRDLQNDAYTMLAKVGIGTSEIRQILEAKLAQITRQLQLTAPNRTVVDSIGKDLEEIPAWFKDNTKLCYRWYPDGEEYECGGRDVKRNLCANVNGMTQFYRDNSDRRRGSCMMSWGIRSARYPDWFSSVKICFRWYSDGDPAQCGRNLNSSLCASIGNFTAYYRDDTDRRSGGCKMSWSIQFPSSAPLWAKTAKLCYQWVADYGSPQCGGPGTPTYMCALADTWTRYYLDDTDARSGGCWMRWGIKI